MRWCVNCKNFLIGVGAGAILGLPSMVLGAAYFQSNIPDFYQHQNSGDVFFKAPGYVPPAPKPNPLLPSYNSLDWWEYNAGWCAVTAWESAFYALDRRGMGGLFTHDSGKTWLQQMRYGIEDFEINWYEKRGFDYPIRSAVTDMLNKYGFASALQFDEYRWNAQTGKVEGSFAGGIWTPTAYSSFLNAYDANIRGGGVVVVRVEGTGDWLHWGVPVNFHMLTGAGVDAAQRRIWYADPNDTLAGAGWGFEYSDSAALPVGMSYYGSGALSADGRTFSDGFFAGAQISALYALAPVPEPATWGLLLVGVVVLLARQQARLLRRRIPQSV